MYWLCELNEITIQTRLKQEIYSFTDARAKIYVENDVESLARVRVSTASLVNLSSLTELFFLA